ncbi:hypothetical protein [Buchananella hordeovulneris]|uniref:hypothetical protein n=1 Tax=Buchananella hordeovulneris TaxID=52770 RepID=UPI0026DB5BE7|nr:hypothetical protein [Buchananella hordeovulneris]MDO5081658.1 hypothetical protein [Buchananella hordeovulneris]
MVAPHTAPSRRPPPRLTAQAGPSSVEKHPPGEPAESFFARIVRVDGPAATYQAIALLACGGLGLLYLLLVLPGWAASIRALPPPLAWPMLACYLAAPLALLSACFAGGARPRRDRSCGCRRSRRWCARAAVRHGQQGAWLAIGLYFAAFLPAVIVTATGHTDLLRPSAAHLGNLFVFAGATLPATYLVAATRWRPLAVVLGLCSAAHAYLALRLTDTSPLTLPVDLLFWYGWALPQGIVAWWFLTEGRVTDRARRRSQRARLALAQWAQRVRQRRGMQAAVHDHVVSVLRAGAWGLAGSLPELPALARRGLTVLERGAEDWAGPTSSRQLLDQLAARVELDAALRGGITFTHLSAAERQLPAGVGHALREAALEALRNIARHARPLAGGRWGSVRVETEAGVWVEITDFGPGFDPQRLGADRAGVRGSILARVQALPGGRAEVTSAPGLRTRVTLSWRPPAPIVGDDDVLRDLGQAGGAGRPGWWARLGGPRGRAWLTGLTLAATLARVLADLEQYDRPWRPLGAWAAMAVGIVLVFVPEAWGSARGRAAAVLGCYGLAVWGVSVGASGPAGSHFVSVELLGAWLLVGTGLRRWQAGLAVYGLGEAWLWVSAVIGNIGAHWVFVSGAYKLAGLVVVSVGAVLVGRTRRATLRACRAADELAARAQLAAARSAVFDSELADVAGACRRLLLQLAAGQAGADLQAECRAVEAQVRDHLTGGHLARVPALREAVTAARAAGVEVVLLDHSGADGEFVEDVLALFPDRWVRAEGQAGYWVRTAADAPGAGWDGGAELSTAERLFVPAVSRADLARVSERALVALQRAMFHGTGGGEATRVTVRLAPPTEVASVGSVLLTAADTLEMWEVERDQGAGVHGVRPALGQI